MKKLFSLLTMLCIAVIASAETNYDLWVCGTRVTSSNASDILGTKVASYNASTKTLTLKQTYLESATNEVITSNIEGLTINVSGTVYLRSTNKDRCTVSLNGKTTFAGSGTSESSLIVTRYDATGYAGFQPIRANCDVEIKNLTMKVSNLNGGTAIRPYRTPDDATTPSAYTLSIKNANVTFTAAGDYTPIYGFKTMSLTGSSLNPKTYYKTGSGNYYVADQSGNSVKSDIVIKDRVYGMFGDKTIRDSNTKIQPSGLKSGSITLYDFAQGGGKYLLLDGVDFTSTNKTGISINSDEPCHFELLIKGTNKINASLPLNIGHGTPGTVYVRPSSSGISTPSLSLEAVGNSPAVDVRSTGLTFRDINLNIKSVNGGIDGYQGYDDDTHTLTFENTYATITDNSTAKKGAIINFKSVTYSNCFFANTSNHVWKNDAYYNTLGGKTMYVAIERGYGILINDRPVTKDNKDDVCGDGKVSYNPSTKTLNLNGVNYKTQATPLQVFTPITINLTGNNTLTTTDYTSALAVYANTTITGSQSASLTAKNLIDRAGILVNQSDLTIKNCEVSAQSNNGFGIKGEWTLNSTTLPGTSTLTLDNASLNVQASSSNECFENFKTITMKDCFVNTFGDHYDPNRGFVQLDGVSPVRGYIEIRPGYGIFVGEKNVNKDNASNIMSGVSYDASSNTLKLNNASISGGMGITAYRDLNISVSGTANTISNSGQQGIMVVNGNLNITGSGMSTSSLTVTATGKDYAAISVLAPNQNKKFSVKNTTLTARAPSGDQSNGIILSSAIDATIQNAEVTAYGNNASFSGMKSLTLTDVEIVAPKNAVFTSGKGITLNGSLVAKEDVKIGAKQYGIAVGGRQITANNYADVFGDGKVKYDPNTNTLTLNNATIGTDGYGISAQTSSRLYINLIGINNVYSYKSYALYHDNTNGITIQSSSDGTLNLSGSYVGSYQVAGDITVMSCNLKVNGMQAKAGNSYNTLTFDNANVTSDCSSGAFKDIDRINISNCYVSDPVGAVFDSSMGGYVSGGTLCKRVVISAGTSAIEGVTLDDSNAPAYDLRGVQVDKNYKGIVIKNGRKYIQK